MKRLTRTLAPALLAIAAAALTACGGESPEQLIASAKTYIANDDAKSAILQAKTLLQDDPSNGEARYLLGKALLLSGDASSASVELRKALDLRYPEDTVVPVLARAMFIQREYQQLTEQFGQTVLSDPMAEADLKTTLASTYGSLGRRDLAQGAADAALKVVPDYGPAKIFTARLQADTGDLDGALAAVEVQIQRTPQDHEAWQLKGDLLSQGKRDPDAALVAYRQAVAVRPNYVPAHSAILNILISKQDVAAAREQLAQLKKVLPTHVQTTFFEGNIEFLDKNYDKANEIAQALLRVAPDEPRILQFAGAVAYERKAFLQAESHLSKALQKAPEVGVTRRLLTLSYLRLNQPAKALATLQPVLEQPNPAAPVYRLVAQAHLLAGDLEQAATALTKAAQLDPSDTGTRTALAVSKVLGGQDDAGLAELRALAAADEGTMADLPLIASLARKQDYPAALRAIDALDKKTPESPVAPNLRARVLMKQGKAAEARADFEESLKRQPGFFPAAAALAQLALMDGKPDVARQFLDGVLKVDPRNMEALLAIARLKAGTGAPREEVAAVFTDAIQKNATDAAPRLALINYHLANRDFKAARDVAQAAAATLPDSIELLEALGRAQAAAGDTNQAITTFNKLASLQPQSPVPFLRLADVQWAAQDREAAMQSLRRALSVAPDNLQAQRAMIDAHLADNRHAEATAVAREIQKQRPTQDVGFLLEGGVEASQQRWDKALEIYGRGLKAAPDSTELATRMHVVLVADKQQAAADRHVADWLRNHPRDAAFRFYLGDLALAQRNLAQAEKQYREVLELQPENALALNNVAWLMATAKQPGAVALARQAVALLPDRPVIMDTLALALAAEGQMPEALDVMKKALALQDKNPQLRLNLAKLLVEAGDKTAAKTELDTLAALGDKFPRQAEVAELLKKL